MTFTQSKVNTREPLEYFCKIISNSLKHIKIVEDQGWHHFKAGIILPQNTGNLQYEVSLLLGNYVKHQK